VASDGISYSVTHNNTKIVLLDVLTEDSTGAMDAVTPWVDTQLKAGDHNQSFVFAHKSMLGEVNKGQSVRRQQRVKPDPAEQLHEGSGQDGTRYLYMRSRPHIQPLDDHQPRWDRKVEQITSGSDSYAYYTPARRSRP